MSQSNIQTIQSIYAAFGRGDVPGILAHLDEDVVWDEDGDSWGVPWFEPRRGKASIPAFFAALAEHTIIHRFEPKNFLAGGDQVAVVIDLEIEVRRTGRRLRELEMHLFTFGREGRVTRFAHVLDRHAEVCAWRGVDP